MMDSRNPSSSRGGSACYYLGCLLGVLLTFALTAFQRFSATHYPVILEHEIMDRLVPAYDDKDLLNKPFCQINMTYLRDYSVINDAKSSIQTVKSGGSWQPDHCQPKYQVAVIVPYRNRADHLKQFLKIIHPFLQSQLLDYKVIVVEQAPGKDFNRAKLFNVGFLESKVGRFFRSLAFL